MDKSGQPLSEDAVRDGRETGLRADHEMYDIVARGAAQGKLVRAKWLDDWGKNGMRSRLVAQQVTQNSPPLVTARLLVSKASVGAEARCLAGWDCSVAFYHAPLDEDIVAIPPKVLCPAGFAKRAWRSGMLTARILLLCLRLRLQKWLFRPCAFTVR